jgi:hypothetical protein
VREYGEAKAARTVVKYNVVFDRSPILGYDSAYRLVDRHGMQHYMDIAFREAWIVSDGEGRWVEKVPGVQIAKGDSTLSSLPAARTITHNKRNIRYIYRLGDRLFADFYGRFEELTADEAQLLTGGTK